MQLQKVNNQENYLPGKLIVKKIYCQENLLPRKHTVKKSTPAPSLSAFKMQATLDGSYFEFGADAQYKSFLRLAELAGDAFVDDAGDFRADHQLALHLRTGTCDQQLDLYKDMSTPIVFVR